MKFANHPIHTKMSAVQQVFSKQPSSEQAAIPNNRAWQGAAGGAAGMLLVILLVAAWDLFGQAGLGYFLIGALFLFGVFALTGLILTLIWRIIRYVPLPFVWVFACTILVLAFMALTAISISTGILLVGLGMTALAALLGASMSQWLAQKAHRAHWREQVWFLSGVVISLLGLSGGVAWLLDPGSPLVLPTNAANLSERPIEPLALPDPAAPGPFPVERLYYGSGKDHYRPEYGAGVDILTPNVDGSGLIAGWSGARTRYWGFGPTALPLNGRVWLPTGDGPFPLVLIVHGQHPMEDFSDPGYGYLGELLASRGFITVSVDENFLNLSPLADLLVLQGLKDENDLRGWLLLEHLRLWKSWNDDPASGLYRKVDMNNIALIGHSRGGEAVAIAAAFNQLSNNPNDGRIRFDCHFNIRSVIGIAPVEGTYLPAGQNIALKNINYLVVHGAQDMDVFTFQGSRQYERVSFTAGECIDCFKSAVYIYGANHEQFNTVWDRKDLFEPIMRLFNLEQLMPAQEQQQIAKVIISAFLEATLHGESGYRSFFQNLRRGRSWLPDTIYLNQYQDSLTQLVSTYEEDIDLTSTTLSGGTLVGNHLTVWREQPIQAKWKNLSSQAVYLGWSHPDRQQPASYTVRLPDEILRLGRTSELIFSLADANEDPSLEIAGGIISNMRQPIDLTVEVIDRNGEAAQLPLSHFAMIQPQIKGQLGKNAFLSPFADSEVILQTYEFQLQDFVKINHNFQPEKLTEIRFLFDRTPEGVIVLDNFGFRSEN